MTAAAALEACLRQDRGRLLAALIARTGDFQRAEDALHEAAASALVHWARTGPPDRPDAWLLRAALRKAIDGYRRESRAQRNGAAMALLAREEAYEPDPEAIPDERLRLIFTCCHPALDPKSRVALTLRSLCGLTTAQIAAVFLDQEATMGQRLSRAKAKIAAARIPFAIPPPEEHADRLDSVLTVLYLVFTAGYTTGPAAGIDLCEEAIFLARLVAGLMPGDAEAAGCLALMLLTHARAAARTGPDGATVPLAAQDRTLWDRARLAEGLRLLPAAPAGPFAIKAAIAACHAGPASDWPRIAALYARLRDVEDTPVVRLNEAVARGETEGPEAALVRLDELAPDLAAFQPFHAARAEFLARSGAVSAAAAAFDRAISLCANPADAAYLAARRRSLGLHEKKEAETKLGQSPTGR